VELEKGSAPFEDQLSEAWKFIRIDPEHVGRSGEEKNGSNKEFQGSSTHGREEWLIRWLLKKLQSPKDEIPR
jgi:nucleolar pre-ribosomal-associated protein 2